MPAEKNENENVNLIGVLPVGVAGDRVPPLVLVDVNALHIRLGVNVVCAAGQSLEEAASVAARVDPGGVVVADPPHHPDAVTLHHAEVTPDLPPEPEEQRKCFREAD